MTVRGTPPTETEKLKNLLDALHRCDRCDNGIDLNWNYCAWCGHRLTDQANNASATLNQGGDDAAK